MKKDIIKDLMDVFGHKHGNTYLNNTLDLIWDNLPKGSLTTTIHPDYIESVHDELYIRGFRVNIEDIEIYGDVLEISW